MGANVRYTSLDPEYLARLDDVVLLSTAIQYRTALAQMSKFSPDESAEVENIRILYTAVRTELGRRGLELDGWGGPDHDAPDIDASK